MCSVTQQKKLKINLYVSTPQCEHTFSLPEFYLRSVNCGYVVVFLDRCNLQANIDNII